MAEAGLGRSSWAGSGAATFTTEAVTRAPSPRRTKSSEVIDGDRVIAIVTEHSQAPAPADECCVAVAMASHRIALTIAFVVTHSSRVVSANRACVARLSR
jgi:hypothetical protein